MARLPALRTDAAGFRWWLNADRRTEDRTGYEHPPISAADSPSGRILVLQSPRELLFPEIGREPARAVPYVSAVGDGTGDQRG